MTKIHISIKLGILAGLINCIAWYAFAKKSGFHAIEVYVYRNYVTFAVLITGVCLSIYLKKRGNNGFIGLKEAIKTGLLFSMILAAVLGIFNYIYYTIITPDTIDYFLSMAKKDLVNNPKVDPLDIPKYLEAERGNFSSFKIVPPILFFGLISSLLAGLAMRNKNSPDIGAN